MRYLLNVFFCEVRDVTRLFVLVIFCVGTVHGEFLSSKKFREEVEHGDVDSEGDEEGEYDENQESDYFLRDHPLQERRIPRNPVR